MLTIIDGKQTGSSESTKSPPSRYSKAVQLETTQHAVLAMLVFSIVALMANLSLPYLIIRPRPLSWQAKRRQSKTQAWLTLSRAWMCSHILTAMCLFGATLSDGFMTSAFFVSLMGVSWALTQWAPFAIITTEIANGTQAIQSIEGRPILSPFPPTPSSPRPQMMDTFGRAEIRSRAGTTMGVHNIAIAMPQMLSAVINSFIFWTCKQLQINDREAMVWVLRIGIIAALCAAYSARGTR